MKTIYSVDTDNFTPPANTQARAVNFGSDLEVLNMIASTSDLEALNIISSSRTARNKRVTALLRAGFSALNAQIAQIAQWNRPRTIRQTFLTLDDHLLRDIGLDRADILRFADDAVPGVIHRCFTVLSKSIRGFVEATVAWNKAQNNRAALIALSDAQLSDIGLSRHEGNLLAMNISADRWPTAEVKMTADKLAKAYRPVNTNVSTSVNSWIISPRKAA
jgi:uncharacterized protein YjiS (DUF1127 family)